MKCKLYELFVQRFQARFKLLAPPQPVGGPVLQHLLPQRLGDAVVEHVAVGLHAQEPNGEGGALEGDGFFSGEGGVTVGGGGARDEASDVVMVVGRALGRACSVVERRT